MVGVAAAGVGAVRAAAPIQSDVTIFGIADAEEERLGSISSQAATAAEMYALIASGLLCVMSGFHIVHGTTT